MILGLFGAGGLGREVLELVRSNESFAASFDEVCFVLTNPSEEEIAGCRVIPEGELAGIGSDGIRLLNCIGDPLYREQVYTHLSALGMEFATLVDSSVYVPSSTTIHTGAIVYKGCSIGPNVTIGADSVMIANSVVSHDSVIGKHVVICPASVVSGACRIGNRVLLGSGCSIKDATTVGDNCAIGLGAAVFKDVPDNSSVIGNPGRAVPRDSEAPFF